MSKDLQQRLRALRSFKRELAPDPTWVSETRALLVSTVKNSAPIQKVRAERRNAFQAMWHWGPSQFIQWVRRPIFATIAVFAGLAGGSLMSVSAAEKSLPGDFFYGLKLATEQARLAWTTAKDEKLKLKTEFTGRRIEELKQVAGHSDQVTKNERVIEVAEILKRDLDTMKRQLTEVSKEESPDKAANVARLVDKKTTEVVSALQETKSQLSPETKEKVTEVQSIAADTGIKAVSVLVEKQQESSDLVSATDVVQALENHAKAVAEATSSTVLQVPLTLASSTTTGPALQNEGATGTLPITVSSTILLVIPTANATGTVSVVSSTATGTIASLPEAVDQLKNATTQAFEIQKSKDKLEGSLMGDTTSTPATSTTSTPDLKESTTSTNIEPKATTGTTSTSENAPR